ncbi:MAG: hypothetical protein J5I47_13370 [Vicingus serpentipes]|nr:hypothetical protein [Vicingus serpentipes]
MIDVVYQYLEGAAKWNELKYSLRSLEQHLKDPFRVWIVGDKPQWLTNVKHIPHERTPNVWCTNCYDATSKLKLVLDHPEIGNEILWMYDDMYLLRDCKLNDLEVYLAVNHFNDLNHSSSGVHKELLFQTLRDLKDAGKTQWNCETHTPRLYSKILLQTVWNKYLPQDNRLLFSTLYFNDVFTDLTPHIMQKPDPFKAGFYGMDDAYSFKSNNIKEINTILSGKTFLNHNDKGLSVALQHVIEELFPDMSSFEK